MFSWVEEKDNCPCGVCKKVVGNNLICVTVAKIGSRNDAME